MQPKCLQAWFPNILRRQVISSYFADFGDEVFLLADADLSRCCFGGDFEAAARLLLLAAATGGDFLELETAAGDFAGDFTAGEDLAAGERTLPRVTRFSAEDGVFDGVFDADRLELRGILTISAIQSKAYI